MRPNSEEWLEREEQREERVASRACLCVSVRAVRLGMWAACSFSLPPFSCWPAPVLLRVEAGAYRHGCERCVGICVSALNIARTLAYASGIRVHAPRQGATRRMHKVFPA